MKRLVACIFIVVVFLKLTGQSLAQSPTPPIICGCPAALNTNIYSNSSRPDGGGSCVSDLQTFQQNPTKNHLWVEDPEITAQGKSDERSRQFLFWVFRSGTIDNDSALIKVWSLARNVTFFSLLLVAAIMGFGIIIGQRTNFSSTIKIWPQITRLMLLLLYVTISSSLVIVLIQLSDVMMKFFIERLGGKDLLNINFGVVSGEENYLRFVGCRDLNIRVQEAAQTELMMLRITNITYYVMGVMLILRKVLLWFMLFVSPFLALLLPFVFIRNVGWIWIGVFFQWIFYGPLFALFLGGLTTVWRSGIPFIFDFSRVEVNPTKCNPTGYIYPTAINILYGGPAQKLAVCSNGNYVDTYAEYIISLIMLWAVIFFPWWLLRIFRDYCCEGIMSMKNILLSMYDQMRGGPPFQPSGPTPTSPTTTFGAALKIPKEIEVPVKMKLETVEQIKNAKTEEIARSLNLNVTNLTDIAHFETNKEVQNNVQKNLNFLQNPTKAETPTERQKYMNIRSELFSRAIREDRSAKQILSSISTSRIEQIQKREELIKSISQQVPVTHLVSVKVDIPREKVQSTSSSFYNTVSQNSQIVNNIAQSTKLQTNQVRTVLSSLAQNSNQSTANITNVVSQQTGIKKEIVNNVLNSLAQNISLDKTHIENRVSQQTGIEKTQVSNVLNSLAQNISQPETNITNSISQQTGIKQDKVRSVSQAYFNAVSQNSQMVTNIAQNTNLQTNEVKTILNTLAQTINKPETNIVNTISQQTGLAKEKVTKVIQAVSSVSPVSQNIQTITNLAQNSQSVNNIAQITKLETSEVKTVLNSLAQNISQPETNIVNTVSQQTGLAKEKVTKVIQAVSSVSPVTQNIQTITNLAQNSQSVNNIAQITKLETSEVRTVLNSLAQNISQPETNIVNTVSQQTGLAKEKVTKVIQAVSSVSAVSQNNQIISNIAQNTNLQANEVSTVLNSLSQQNISQEPAGFTEKISSQTGIEKEKVKKIIEVYSETVKESKQLVKQIAKEQNIKEEQVEQIISEQIPTGPKAEKQIEQTISIPPSISLDEYEQVKKMWKDQYERGEVPVSDNIKSRNEWVKNDSVFITNVLNKLVSDSPEMRQQGLDEIGYILPIFLINNLKGDQLVVYLKAKLEAAKEIQNVLEEKEAAKAEVKEQKEEELVDVEEPKADEQAKTMEMKEEVKEEVKDEELKSST